MHLIYMYTFIKWITTKSILNSNPYMYFFKVKYKLVIIKIAFTVVRL